MGKVFNIQRLCVDDGPGVRTTVFLSGCPMRCLWCHNPEGMAECGKVFYYSERCVLCGRCASICSCHRIENGIHMFDRTACRACGRCTQLACGALELSARDMSAREVIECVMRDERYYKQSGGGVTFSGGEPMLQYSFLKQLLVEAKKNGLHVCLETAGFAPTARYLEILEYVDLFLFDYKLSDAAAHEKYTGVPLAPILKNLYALNDHGAGIILRCIILPGINDTDAHFESIGRLADELDGVREVHLEPYHELGNSKRERLGEKATLSKLSAVSDEKGAEYLARIPTRKRCIF